MNPNRRVSSTFLPNWLPPAEVLSLANFPLSTKCSFSTESPRTHSAQVCCSLPSQLLSMKVLFCTEFAFAVPNGTVGWFCG
jgi:hypothetical protein